MIINKYCPKAEYYIARLFGGNLYWISRNNTYLVVLGDIDFTSFYHFYIWLWNCSNSVLFFPPFYFIFLQYTVCIYYLVPQNQFNAFTFYLSVCACCALKVSILPLSTILIFGFWNCCHFFFFFILHVIIKLLSHFPRKYCGVNCTHVSNMLLVFFLGLRNKTGFIHKTRKLPIVLGILCCSFLMFSGM